MMPTLALEAAFADSDNNRVGLTMEKRDSERQWVQEECRAPACLLTKQAFSLDVAAHFAMAVA